jgi:AraC family transcriptional regulator of adaptative response/methylated-DNA-[protein]-cysteine methyltransferase
MITKELFSSRIETKLGPMLAIANYDYLYALLFCDEIGVEKKIHKVAKNSNSTIKEGKTPVTDSIAKELGEYFDGKLSTFNTPIKPIGSPFQLTVWKMLGKVSHGQACSYEALAINIKKPTAFRAVANANGKNNLAIIIPCHRIINKSGKLGGYSGGLSKKEWLLKHEGISYIS